MALSEIDTGYNLTYIGNLGVNEELDRHTQKWLKIFETNVDSAIGAMADSIKAKAQMTVPYKNGDLHDSARVEGKNLSREVIFGGGGIEYGTYQERGERIDHSHKVLNYTTPGTGSHFLKNATEIVLKEGIGRYYK